MKWAPVCFPKQSRGFPGKRWVRIGLRSIHIYTICGVVGGAFFDISPNLIHHFYLGALITGLLLIITDLYSNGIWLLQNRGYLILAKISILPTLPHLPRWENWGLFLIVIVSGIIAHAPGSFRYYSVFYRKRIDQL